MKFISVCFLLLTIHTVYAAPPPPYRPGRMTLSADAQYFRSGSNYDIDGNKVSLFQDNNYSNVNSSFDLNYNFSDGWIFGGGAGFAYANSSDPIEVRTNSEFTDIHLLGQKIYSYGSLRITPETKIAFALNEIAPNQDEVLTSEAVNTYQLGSWIRYRTDAIMPYAFIGYQSRSQGRSALMPWMAGLQTQLKLLSAAIELGGYQSISDDADTGNETSRYIVNERVSAGSLRNYAVNPSLTEIRLMGEIELNQKYRVGAMGGYTLMGERTAQGYSVGFSLALSVDPFSVGTERNKKITNENLNKEFQPDLEEDAESLINTSE